MASTNEMTGIQALERLHPSLSMLPGHVEREEFEYERHGTLSLIANIEWDRQHRGAISVSGDTVLFEELQEIPRRYHLRNALLHFGAAPFDVFGPAYHTFTAAERARFAKTLGETIVIPLHFEGWAHFTEGRTQIEQAFTAARRE